MRDELSRNCFRSSPVLGLARPRLDLVRSGVDSESVGSWIEVDAAAIALAESAPLLMTPGRRCEIGKPVPVARADWQKYVQGLVEADRAAYRASQRRNQEAVAEANQSDLRRLRKLPPCLPRHSNADAALRVNGWYVARQKGSLSMANC